jgi:hypothetical protein
MDAKVAGGWSWDNIDDSIGATTSGADIPRESQWSDNSGGAADRSYPPGEPEQTQQRQKEDEQPPRPRRRYGPRTCRICLEQVEPTFINAEGAAGYFQREPRVVYESPADDGGRLFSPCKCKGSQKYVHEGCLEAWRRAAPTSDRHYWSCPTCKFDYQVGRLKWGRWITSKITRGALTLAVFILTIFFLGFIGDPIINLWLDPYNTIADTVTGSDYQPFVDDEDDGWVDHFLKGFVSMGVLGFLKTLVGMSPFYWFRIGGGDRRRRGRQRMENMSWIMILVGILTFVTVRHVHPTHEDITN